MKLSLRSAAILLFLSSLSLHSFGQISSEDSIKYSNQILRIEQMLLDAIAAGDTLLWSKYLDKNYYTKTEDGTEYNKANFLASFGPLPNGYSGQIMVMKPHLIFKEKTAVLHYVADEYEWVWGQKIHTTYATLNIYVQTDTSWKIIAGQVFEIPQLPPAINVSEELLKTYTGTYHLTDTVTCTVTLESKKLCVQKKGHQKSVLSPETNNIFFREADTRGRKIFMSDSDGTMLMRERRNGQDVVWKRERNP